MEEFVLRPVAHIRNSLKTKFGIPRQSLLAPELISKIVFTGEFRGGEALRGISEFSHLWIIWCFSESVGKEKSFTVRPPRLGGNERVGVFATRSPFRPNDLGLSCVKLERVEKTPDEGTVLIVSGADIMDGTPIFDIKPYLPYADKIENASGGFAPDGGRVFEVEDPGNALGVLSGADRETVVSLLRRDPRPRYHDDPERIYGMRYGEWDIKFRVVEEKVRVLSVDAAVQSEVAAE